MTIYKLLLFLLVRIFRSKAGINIPRFYGTKFEKRIEEGIFFSPAFIRENIVENFVER